MHADVITKPEACYFLRYFLIEVLFIFQPDYQLPENIPFVD